MTDCLEAPTENYTKPEPPPAIITGEWAARAWDWMNRTLGIATNDRIAWRGERRCIRKKAETGAIR